MGKDNSQPLALLYDNIFLLSICFTYLRVQQRPRAKAQIASLLSTCRLAVCTKRLLAKNGYMYVLECKHC